MARLATLLAPILLLGACAGGPDAPSEDNLASVPVSGVRNQKETGNCWLFATANWVESLELGSRLEMHARPGPDKHISIAYWDYWDWYAKITGERVTRRTEKGLRDELDTGGSWGEAVELIAARGLVRAKDFLGDGEAHEAEAVERALGIVARSLLDGDLKTVAARRDGVIVRRELDRAFGLRAEVVQAMSASFGDAGAATFKKAKATAVAPVVSAEQIAARCPRPDGAPVMGTLLDAIGTRVGGQDPDVRTGELAWTRVRFDAKSAASRREFFRRIQRVLRQGAAVPVAWYWASNGDPDNVGEFKTTPTTPAIEADSTFHETLIYDYEITDVPELGTLRAGRAATDAEQDAALAPEANITFFRVLDSYFDAKRTERRGFSDIYLDYLLHELEVCPRGDPRSPACEKILPLDEVTLPRGF
jgi:hypothetical protein